MTKTRAAAAVLASLCAALLVPALLPSSAADAASYRYVRSAAPSRTVVQDARGATVAVLTDGARTVVLTGPSRVFAEPTTTSATVRTTAWVRLLPAPFTGTVNESWLAAALADRTPDMLAEAMSFVTGGARDASYGPLVSGSRQEGSDWNDYLGVTATYDGAADAAEPTQLGSLDCSGYVRMVLGRIGGIPMVINPDGVRLPRRSTTIAASAPGLVVVPNSGTKPVSYAALQPGDLVFFDASTTDGTAIDHTGIYLGRDNAGHYRFLSSRKTVDGPTMGDVGGRSQLDGTGLYSTTWRSARRI